MEAIYSRPGPFLAKLVERDNIVFTLAGICLVKLLVFSLLVETPQMGWEWEIKTVPALLFSCLGLLALIFAPAFLFRRRKSQVYYCQVINGVITGFIIANRAYNLFFHSYISPETIMHSTEGISMLRALFSIMRFREFLWLVDFPLLYFFVQRRYAPPKEKSEEMPALFERLGQFAKISLIGFFVFAFSLNISSHEQRHPNVSLREGGMLLFYLRETTSYLAAEEEEVFSEDVQYIREWFEEHREEREEIEKETRRYFGEAEGKNLIVLQVEALQEIVIGKTINGQEITPNLNRLKEESVYFENCFDQVDMATADAEVLANLSLFPLTDVSVYMRYPGNHFNSLARTLRDSGYEDAATFHGFKREFYNRKEAYPNMGFNKYFSRRHYELDEMHNNLLGDKTFLRQTAAMMEDLEEPYYSFVITLTSHHPFNYLEDYDEIDVGEFENTIVGDYIRSIHYTDAAIGQFYDRLEDKGTLNESLLVVYGDHVAFNYSEIDWEALNEFFDADMREPVAQMKEHRVPLFYRLPGGNVSKVVDEKAGMIDIFPTTANLLGVQNHYLMGRDLLNTEEEMVILKRGSFLKDNYFYHAPTRTMHDLVEGGQRVVQEDHEHVQKAEKALRISEMIYQIDFFREIEYRSSH